MKLFPDLFDTLIRWPNLQLIVMSTSHMYVNEAMNYLSFLTLFCVSSFCNLVVRHNTFSDVTS
jgi:hypothetical protein